MRMTSDRWLVLNSSAAITMALLVACLSDSALNETVQGCVGDTLEIQCPKNHTIRISAVLVGDSSCARYGKEQVEQRSPRCCPDSPRCFINASLQLTQSVKSQCDTGQQRCSVLAGRETLKDCLHEHHSQNDFERIVYGCLPILVDPARTFDTKSAIDPSLLVYIVGTAAGFIIIGLIAVVTIVARKYAKSTSSRGAPVHASGSPPAANTESYIEIQYGEDPYYTQILNPGRDQTELQLLSRPEGYTALRQPPVNNGMHTQENDNGPPSPPEYIDIVG